MVMTNEGAAILITIEKICDIFDHQVEDIIEIKKA